MDNVPNFLALRVNLTLIRGISSRGSVYRHETDRYRDPLFTGNFCAADKYYRDALRNIVLTNLWTIVAISESPYMCCACLEWHGQFSDLFKPEPNSV